MNLKTFLIVTVGVTPCAVQASELCARQVSTTEAMIAGIVADGGKVILDDRQYTALAEENLKIVWTFVKPGHPAYPAVVCRQIYQDGDLIKVRLTAQCGAPEPACKAYIESYSRK